jgi:hypothetical protein
MRSGQNHKQSSACQCNAPPSGAISPSPSFLEKLDPTPTGLVWVGITKAYDDTICMSATQAAGSVRTVMTTRFQGHVGCLEVPAKVPVLVLPLRRTLRATGLYPTKCRLWLAGSSLTWLLRYHRRRAPPPPREQILPSVRQTRSGMKAADNFGSICSCTCLTRTHPTTGLGKVRPSYSCKLPACIMAALSSEESGKSRKTLSMHGQWV